MLLTSLIIVLLFGASHCPPPRTCCVLNVEIHESRDRVSYIQALGKVYVNLVTDTTPYRTLEKGDKIDVLDTDPSHTCYDFETWIACGTYLNYSIVNDCIFTAFGFTTLCTHVKWQSYITDWHWAMFALFCITIFGFFFRNTFGVCLKYCGPITCCAKTKTNVSIDASVELDRIKRQLADMHPSIEHTLDDSGVHGEPPLKRVRPTRYIKPSHSSFTLVYSMLFFCLICISIGEAAPVPRDSCCVVNLDAPHYVRALRQIYVYPPPEDKAVSLECGEKFFFKDGILPTCYDVDTLTMCHTVYSYTSCHNAIMYSHYVLIGLICVLFTFYVALKVCPAKRMVTPKLIDHEVFESLPDDLEGAPPGYTEIDENEVSPRLPTRRSRTMSLNSYLIHNMLLISLCITVVDSQLLSSTDIHLDRYSMYVDDLFRTLAFVSVVFGFITGFLCYLFVHYCIALRARARINADTTEKDSHSPIDCVDPYDTKVDSEVSPRQHKSFKRARHPRVYLCKHIMTILFCITFCCFIGGSSSCRSNFLEIEKNGERTTAFRYGFNVVVVPSEYAYFLLGGSCGPNCKVMPKDARFYIFGYPLSSGTESVHSSHVRLRIAPIIPPLPVECVSSDYKFFHATVSDHRIIPTGTVEPARYYYCYTCSSNLGTDLLGIYGPSQDFYINEFITEDSDFEIDIDVPDITTPGTKGPMLATHRKYPDVSSAVTFFPPWIIRYTTNKNTFAISNLVGNKKRCVEIHDPTAPDAHVSMDTGLLYSCRVDIDDSNTGEPLNPTNCLGGVSTRHFISICYADHLPSSFIFSVGTCLFSVPVNPQPILSFCGCVCTYARQPIVNSGRSIFYSNCVCDHDLNFASIRAAGTCYSDSNLKSGKHWFIGYDVAGDYQDPVKKVLPPVSGIYRYINGCPHPSGNVLAGTNDTDFFVSLKPGLDKHVVFPITRRDTSVTSDSSVNYENCVYSNASIYFGYQPCVTPSFHCLHRFQCPEYNDPIVVEHDTVDSSSPIPCICGIVGTQFKEDFRGVFVGGISKDCVPYLGTYQSHNAVSYHGYIVWIDVGDVPKNCTLRDVENDLPPYDVLSRWYLKYDCTVKQSLTFSKPPYKNGCLPDITSSVIEQYSELGNHRAVSFWVCNETDFTHDDINSRTVNGTLDYGAGCDSKYPVDSALLNTSNGLVYYAIPSHRYGSHMCYFFKSGYSHPFFNQSIAVKDGEIYVTGHVVYTSGSISQKYHGLRMWVRWPNGTEILSGFCTLLGHGALIEYRGVPHVLHWYPNHLTPSICSSHDPTTYTVPDLYKHYISPNITYDGCHNIDSTGCCMDPLLYKSMNVSFVQNAHVERYNDTIFIYHKVAGISHYPPKQNLPIGGTKYYYTPDGILPVNFDMPVLNDDHTYLGPICKVAKVKTTPHFARINDTHVCVSFHEYSPPYTNSASYKMEMLEDYGHPDFALQHFDDLYPVFYTPDVSCGDYYASMVLSGYYEIGGHTFQVYHTPLWQIPSRCYNMPPMLTSVHHSAEFDLPDVPVYYYSVPATKSTSSIKLQFVNDTIYKFRDNSIIIPAFVGNHLVLGADEIARYVYADAMDHPFGDNVVEDFETKCSSSPMHWHCIVVIAVSSFLGCVLLCGLAVLLVMRKRHVGDMSVPQDDTEPLLPGKHPSKTGNGRMKKRYRPRSKSKSRSRPDKKSGNYMVLPYHAVIMLFVFCCIVCVSSGCRSNILEIEKNGHRTTSFRYGHTTVVVPSDHASFLSGGKCGADCIVTPKEALFYLYGYPLSSGLESVESSHVNLRIPEVLPPLPIECVTSDYKFFPANISQQRIIPTVVDIEPARYYFCYTCSSIFGTDLLGIFGPSQRAYGLDHAYEIPPDSLVAEAPTVNSGPMLARHNKYPAVYSAMTFFPPWIIRYTTNNHIFITKGSRVDKKRCVEVHDPTSPDGFLDPDTGLLYSCRLDVDDNALNASYNANNCFAGVSTRHFIFICYAERIPSDIIFNVGTCSYTPPNRAQNPLTFCGCTCKYSKQSVNPGRPVFYTNCVCDHDLEFSSLRVLGTCYVDSNLSSGSQWFVNPAVSSTFQDSITKVLPPTSGIYRYINGCTHPSGNLITGDLNSTDFFVNLLPHLERHSSFPFAVVKQSSAPSDYGYFGSCMYGNSSNYFGFQPCFTPNYHCLHSSDCPEFRDPVTYVDDTAFVATPVPCVCPVTATKFREGIRDAFAGSITGCVPYLGTYQSHDAVSYRGRIVWINAHLNSTNCTLHDVGSDLASYEDISNWFLKYDCKVKQSMSYPLPPFKDGCLPQVNSKVIERYSELGNRRAIARWACINVSESELGPNCDSKYPIDSALLNSSRGLIYYATPSYRYGGHMCYYHDPGTCPDGIPFMDKSVALKGGTVYITGQTVYSSDFVSQSFHGHMVWARWPNGTRPVFGYCTALGHGVAIKCQGNFHFLHWYPDHISPSVCNSHPKSDYTLNDHTFDAVLPPSYTYNGCHNVDATGCCMDSLLQRSLSVTKISYDHAETHDDDVLIYHQGAGVSHYPPKQILPPGDVKYYYTPDGVMTTMFDMPVLNNDYTYPGPPCVTAIPKSSPHFARINGTHVCISFHEYSPPYNNSTTYKMEMLQDYYHPDFTLKNIEGMYPVLYTPDIPCSDYYNSMVLSGYYEVGSDTFEVYYTPVWHIPPRCYNKPPLLTHINHSSEFGLSGVPVHYYSMPTDKSTSPLKLQLLNGTLYRFKDNSLISPAFVDNHLVLGATVSGKYVYARALEHPSGDNVVEDFESKCSASPMHWHCIVVITIACFLGFILLCGIMALLCVHKRERGYMPVPQSDIDADVTEHTTMLSHAGDGKTKTKKPYGKARTKNRYKPYKMPYPQPFHLLYFFFLVTVVSSDWQGSISDCERTYPMGDKKDFPPYIKSPFPYTPIGKHSDSNFRLGSHPDMAYFMAESGFDFYLGSDNVGGHPLTSFKQPIQDSDFTSAFDADRIISGTFGCAGGVKCNCNYTFERSVLPTTPGTVVSSAIVCNNISWPYAMRIYSRPVEYNCVHYASTSPWTYSYCDRYDCDEDCPSYLINGYCGPKCYDGSYNVYMQPETIQVKHDTMSGISDGCGSVETGTQVVIVRNIADLRKVDHVGKCSLHSRSALVCLLVVDRVTCHMAKDFSFLNANVSFEIVEESDPVPSFDYTIRTSDGKVYDSLFGDLGISWNPPSWGHYTDFRMSNFYKSDIGYYPTAINYDVAPTFSFDWDCSWTGAAYSPEGDSSHCHVTINGVATDSGYSNLYQDDLVHLGGIYRDTILLGYDFSEVPADDDQHVYSPVVSVTAAFVPNYGHGYFSFSNSFDVTAPPNVYSDWVDKNNVVLQLHDCKLGLSVGGNTGCYITATIKAGAPTMPVSLHCKYPMYCDTALAIGPYQTEYYVEVHAYASHAEVGDLKINVTVKGVVVSTLSTSDWSLRGTETRGLMSYGMSEVMPRRPSPGGKSDTAVSTEWTVAIVLGVVAFLLIGGFILALYCFRKSKRKHQAAGDGGVGKCAVAGLVIVVLSFVAVLGVLAYFIFTAISGVSGIISAPLDAVEGLVSDAIAPDANVSNWNDLNATTYSCAVHYTATLTHYVSPINSLSDIVDCVRGCESKSCPGYVMDDVCRYMTNDSEVSRVFRESYTCTNEPELIGKPAHSGVLGLSPSFILCVSVAMFTMLANGVRGVEAYDVDRDDDHGRSGRGRGYHRRSPSRTRGRSPRRHSYSPHRDEHDYYKFRPANPNFSRGRSNRGRGRGRGMSHAKSTMDVRAPVYYPSNPAPLVQYSLPPPEPIIKLPPPVPPQVPTVNPGLSFDQAVKYAVQDMEMEKLRKDLADTKHLLANKTKPPKSVTLPPKDSKVPAYVKKATKDGENWVPKKVQHADPGKEFVKRAKAADIDAKPPGRPKRSKSQPPRQQQPEQHRKELKDLPEKKPPNDPSLPTTGPLAGYDLSFTRKNVLSAGTFGIFGTEEPVEIVIAWKPASKMLPAYTNRAKIAELVSKPLRVAAGGGWSKHRDYSASSFDVNDYSMYEHVFPFLSKAELRELGQLNFKGVTLSGIINNFAKTGDSETMATALKSLVSMTASGEEEKRIKALEVHLAVYPYIAMFHKLIKKPFSGAALVSYMLSLFKLEVAPLALMPRTRREKAFTRDFLGALSGASGTADDEGDKSGDDEEVQTRDVQMTIAAPDAEQSTV